MGRSGSTALPRAAGRLPEAAFTPSRRPFLGYPRGVTRPTRPGALGPLLALATLGILGTAAFAWAWWQERGRGHEVPASLDARESLLEDLLHRSPGILVPTLFEPDIGYTLQPHTELEAWDDTFTSNHLGYRTRTQRKQEGVFRVLFVGDSWTYGMGVREQETFAVQVEELARELVPRPPTVQAWILALPGYNTLSEVAALDTYFDRLQPDAVVFCPTVNDADSSMQVLPHGSSGYAGYLRDNYGGRIPLVYKGRWYDSYEAQERWRRAGEAMGKVSRRLAAHDVPLLFFFTGYAVSVVARRPGRTA